MTGVETALLLSYVSAGAAVAGGVQAYQAGKAEQAQYKAQADAEALRAKQEEGNRQAELTRILNTQMAMGAGRGTTVGSGSNLAITDFSIEEAKREGGIAALDSRFRQSQMRQSGRQARMSGMASLLNGVASGASTAYSGYSANQDRKLTTK